jgi:uncharacterized protein
MTAGLAPGVYTAYVPPVEPIPVATDVAGFIGIAERGPTDRLVAVESWRAFEGRYGTFLPNAHLAYAVRGFFDNGGRRCYIARVAAPSFSTTTTGLQPADYGSSIVSDAGPITVGTAVSFSQSTTATSAGVQPANRMSSKLAVVTGFRAGTKISLRQAGKLLHVAIAATVDPLNSLIHWSTALPPEIDISQPINFNATTTDARIVAAVTGNTLKWSAPLDARFDLAAPISIAAGAARAASEIPDEDGNPLMGITAIDEGQWGNRLDVRVTRTMHSPIAVRQILAIDTLQMARIAELATGSIIDVRQFGVPTFRTRITNIDREKSHIRISPSLAGFDIAGANDGSVPANAARQTFALAVSEAGTLVESHVGLDVPSPTAGDLQVKLNSGRISAIRLPGDPLSLPDPGSMALENGQCRLTGGRDGIAMLRPVDFTGRDDDAQRLGLRLFETQDEPSAIAMPDAVIPGQAPLQPAPPQPNAEPDPCILCPQPALPKATPLPPPLIEAAPVFGLDAVLAMQSALVGHCDLRGDRIAVLDPPLASGAERFDLDALADWRQSFDSSYAATYFPWLSVVDPLAGEGGELRVVPASGHAMGQFSLADHTPGRSVPANRVLAWVAALPRDLDEIEHGDLNSLGVNCILARPGRAIRAMGARTMSSNASLRQLVVRRLLIRLKRLFAFNLRWAVFEPNDGRFRQSILGSIESLLEDEWIGQRLAGNRPEQAFRLAAPFSADDSDNGRFIVDIAVAPALPAEFVYLRLARTMDRLELAEVAAPEGMMS